MEYTGWPKTLSFVAYFKSTIIPGIYSSRSTISVLRSGLLTIKSVEQSETIIEAIKATMVKYNMLLPLSLFIKSIRKTPLIRYLILVCLVLGTLCKSLELSWIPPISCITDLSKSGLDMNMGCYWVNLYLYVGSLPVDAVYQVF
jgi:hypothetical protein